MKHAANTQIKSNLDQINSCDSANLEISAASVSKPLIGPMSQLTSALEAKKIIKSSQRPSLFRLIELTQRISN